MNSINRDSISILKNFIRYIFIFVINSYILIQLSEIWPDELSKRTSSLIGAGSFFELDAIFLSLISLFCIGVIELLFKSIKKNSLKHKYKFSIIITLLVCSLMYADLIYKYSNNHIFHKELRAKIFENFKNYGRITGLKGESLSWIEYEEITKTCSYPEISKNATNISFTFKENPRESFFYFHLEYVLPKSEEIMTYRKYNEGKKTYNLIRQDFEIKPEKKRVIYEKRTELLSRIKAHQRKDRE